jgi:hypothetical protein
VNKFLRDFIYYEDGSLMGNNKIKYYGEGAKYEGMFENVNYVAGCF